MQAPPRFRTSLISDSGEIRIGITPDNLEAWLQMSADTPESTFTRDQIFALLKTEGIVYGVDYDRIEALCRQINQDRAPIHWQCIARGQPPVPGKDGRIEYDFETQRKPKLQESHDGHIDYKELGLINNVNANQRLARKIPPIEPEEGQDIYGRPIQPPKPREANFVAGANVRISEDGLECFAEVDGQVILKRMMIQVSPIYEVPLDVDLNVGNIDFNGSVVIHGNVMAGFTVKARKNITVLGVVEAANLQAGGDIYIKKGIKGSEKAVIQANGNITVKFIESANLVCQGHIMAETSIVNSDVLCYGKVKVARQKGTIVGGHVRAVQGIECLEIGSRLGVTTRVTAGDKFLLRIRMQECEEKLKEIQELLQKIEAGIKKLDVHDTDRLPPQKKASYDRILNQKQDLLEQRLETETRKEKLAALFQAPTTGRIYAQKTCHSNVHITIGHSALTTQGDYVRTGFYEDPHTHKIRIGSI